MTRGFLFLRHKIIIVLLLMFMAIAGLSGCGTPTQSEVLIPIVLCTPESPIVNIYRVAPQSWANVIFEFAFPLPPTPQNDQQILGARYAAFEQLVNQAKRWSDTKTIILDDWNKATITVTFISPELLQAVFLNEVLKERFLTSGFQDHLQNVLNNIAERNELLFLLTVTTTNNSVNPSRRTIKIPIQEMVMHNAKNLTIIHSHDDHNLEQTINTTSDPVFGYLGYPLSQTSGSQCEWVLDPKFNKNIVMTVPFLEVDGLSNKTPYFWTIPYAPLMNLNLPSETPDFNLPPGYDTNLMTPLAMPPPGDINQTNNWQDFGRFIWGEITLGNF